MPKEEEQDDADKSQRIDPITSKTLGTIAGMVTITFLITKSFCSILPKTPERIVALIAAIGISMAAAHFYKSRKQKDRYFLGFLNGLLVFCTVSGFSAATTYIAPKGPEGITLPLWATPILPDPTARNLVNLYQDKVNRLEQTVQRAQVPESVRREVSRIAQERRTTIQQSPYSRTPFPVR